MCKEEKDTFQPLISLFCPELQCISLESHIAQSNVLPGHQSHHLEPGPHVLSYLEQYKHVVHQLNYKGDKKHKKLYGKKSHRKRAKLSALDLVSS